MKKFTIPVIFSFEGEAYVNAKNKEEAISIISDHLRARFGSVSDDNNNKIIDWNIDCGAYPAILEQQIVED